MKLFQIVSVAVLIVSVLYFTPKAYAQIQFYDADADLASNGNAKIKLTINFVNPETEFQMTVLGAVKNVNASTNSGPVACTTTGGAASIINCKMSLTPDRRTFDLSFETQDFAKNLGDRNLFTIDLSLGQDISAASATVKLPEGYALANTSLIPAASPTPSNIVSDGRRIIINWNFQNIKADQSFRVQTLYEPIENNIPTNIISIIVTLVLVIVGGAFFYFRRSKQPKEVILSVLDDFEKRIVEVITAAGGEINQRRVVQETNLSKAKVSRVIKRLQERGLIEVIHLGRTNKLKLAHKKFEGK
ncbi:MAG: winged helix-turn-helix transcriptional regulator [Candidatus Aenigmarchaeota archaeon]|nr:winged helix-turn-helix transcriptional regulator [Candidatus Aenigmarchaeota archaeon]